MLLRSLRSVSIFALALAVAAPASAMLILDTGTPDESGAQGVYYDPTFGSATFVAQEFTLNENTTLSGIEVYAGGLANNGFRLQVATQIGPAADPSDVLGGTEIMLPGTPSFSTDGEWVLGNIDLALNAGTYFLVISPLGMSGNPFLGSSFLPTDAPNVLGDRYTASDGMNPLDNVDLTDPLLSGFVLNNSFQPGIRFYSVPEPAALALFASVGWALFGRRSRKG